MVEERCERYAHVGKHSSDGVDASICGLDTVAKRHDMLLHNIKPVAMVNHERAQLLVLNRDEVLGHRLVLGQKQGRDGLCVSVELGCVANKRLDCPLACTFPVKQVLCAIVESWVGIREHGLAELHY